jgi:hypothetical protein
MFILSKMRCRRLHQAAGAAIGVVLLGLGAAAPAATSECAIPVPRQGLQRIELFANSKNDGYLLIRFSDPRFDDTTEVYRLRGCSKVASGVTAKSTFEKTLTDTGFKSYGSLAMGSEHEVVNSYYGVLKIVASPEAVKAVLAETDPARLEAIAALKSLVLLREAVPLERLALIRNDSILSLVPAEEYAAAAANSLTEQQLAKAWVGLEGTLATFAGQAIHPALSTHYTNNLTRAIRLALGSRQAMGGALDAAATAAVQSAGPNGRAVANALLTRMTGVGHDSVPTQLQLVNIARQAGSFDAAADMFEQAKISKSSEVRAEASQVLGAAALGVAAGATAGGPMPLVAALERLNRLGFDSQPLLEKSMEVLRGTRAFDATLALSQALGRFGAVQRNEAWKKEMAGRVEQNYVALAQDSTYSTAGPARDAFLALHKAGYLTLTSSDALVKVVRQRGRFDDALQAHQATGDLMFVDKLQDLARSPAERASLELVAVNVLPDKSSLIDFDFDLERTTASGGLIEGGHFLNFITGKDVRRAGHKVIRGILTVKLNPNRPVQLAQAQCRFVFELVASARGTRSARGFTLQGDSEISRRVSTRVTVTLGAGNDMARIQANLGDMEVAYLDRGAAGGYTSRVVDGDGTVEVQLISTEVVRP